MIRVYTISDINIMKPVWKCCAFEGAAGLNEGAVGGQRSAVGS